MEPILETQPILALVLAILAMAVRELFVFLSRKHESQVHSVLISQVSEIERKVDETIKNQEEMVRLHQDPNSTFSTIGTNKKLDNILLNQASTRKRGD